MKVSARYMIIAGAGMLAATVAAPASAFLQDPRAVVEAGVAAWQRGDFAGAVKQWRPLAEKGDQDAQFNMGQAYRLGRGVPVDLRIAQSWFQKAAAQGHEMAQGNLGLLLYESGKRAEAMPWIRKAAGRGDPRAQYVLGVELTNGDIVPRDFPRAYALMTRAASKGLPPAAKSLEQMEKFIPAADRQKGIALARQMQDAPALAGLVTVPAAEPAGRAAPRVAGRAPAVTPSEIPPRRPAATAVATAPGTAPAAARAPARAARPAAGGGWRAQLGAYGSPAAAAAQWAALSRRIGGLAGLQPSYEKAGAFTRLRVGPLGSRAAADKVCAQAKAAGQACFPVAP
ncbi:MAG: SPOR domain-containing protein [Pseudomonadota bacterium]|nr:SPOR domain-containing protein [Pseudomonadota bacterium]